MQKTIVDGKEINIPLNKQVEIKAKESVETIVEENGSVSKAKLTKDSLIVQCEKKTADGSNLDAEKIIEEINKLNSKEKDLRVIL